MVPEQCQEGRDVYQESRPDGVSASQLRVKSQVHIRCQRDHNAAAGGPHRRATEWNLLIGAMVLSGGALGLMPFASDVALIVALAFVLGVGLGGAQPMIMSPASATK